MHGRRGFRDRHSRGVSPQIQPAAMPAAVNFFFPPIQPHLKYSMASTVYREGVTSPHRALHQYRMAAEISLGQFTGSISCEITLTPVRVLRGHDGQSGTRNDGIKSHALNLQLADEGLSTVAWRASASRATEPLIMSKSSGRDAAAQAAQHGGGRNKQFRLPYTIRGDPVVPVPVRRSSASSLFGLSPTAASPSHHRNP